MGENNTQTALKGCGVKMQTLVIHVQPSHTQSIIPSNPTVDFEEVIIKVKVVVLHPAQQLGSYWDRPEAII